MNLLGLACRLNKTIYEIEQISLSEFNEWMAYFTIIGEQDG